MFDQLLEKIKNAKGSLSSSLRQEIILCGEKVVRPLIRLLPNLSSYLITSDLIELLGEIGGNDSFNALDTLLEDAPEGNLPKRLISQSSVRGLYFIRTPESIQSISKALSFEDVEIKITAIQVLTKMAKIYPELQDQIKFLLLMALDKETNEKPGRLLEESLISLGQPVTARNDWKNTTKQNIIEPTLIQTKIPPLPLYKNNSQEMNVKINSPSTKQSFQNMTNDEEKELIDKFTNSSENKDKLEILEKISNSGNLNFVDELLAILKSSNDSIIKNATVDALLKIAPQDIKLRFLVLEYILDKRVIGQIEAKLAIANALRIAQVGLKRTEGSNKPIGSYLFVGPTGVGKTELAKALSEALYGSELKLIRLDMSEFTDVSDKNKLIGSPPGYVGSNEGGKLTQSVLKQPQSVILFDEIEKAHPEIFNLFLQLLDDGRLTDSKGITVSFRDTIIIMTSNVGSEYILEALKQNVSNENLKEIIKESLKTVFKPEFLNRLNEYIIFKPLTPDELLQVLNIKLKPTANILKNKYNLSLEITDTVKSFIIDSTKKQEFGFSPRELSRIIDQEIVNPLSERLLDMEISESYTSKPIIPRGGRVIIDIKDSTILLEILDKA